MDSEAAQQLHGIAGLRYRPPTALPDTHVPSCHRSAWMSAAYDPTLPLGAAITFCVYRLFAKRKTRAPDGPYWGNSPVWGALGTTLLGLLAGGVVRLPAASSANIWCRSHWLRAVLGRACGMSASSSLRHGGGVSPETLLRLH
jgi:hypothetical protein